MATLRVQTSFNQGFGTELTNILLTGVVAGDLLTLCLRERDGSAEPTVSDNVNGSWGASDITDADPSGNGRASIFSFVNAAGGDTTISVVYGVNRVFQGNAAAWTPAGGTTFSVDQTGSNSPATTMNHAAASITAGAGVIIAAAAHSANSGGETIGDGFTALTMVAGEREYHRYKLTSGETVDADYTTVNTISSNQIITSYLETSAGGVVGPLLAGHLTGRGILGGRLA